MSAQTTLELGAVEAIKRCHRTIREATKTVVLYHEHLLASGPKITEEQRLTALSIIKAVGPILFALTGQAPEKAIHAALKRLVADGLIQTPPNMGITADIIATLAEHRG